MRSRRWSFTPAGCRALILLGWLALSFPTAAEPRALDDRGAELVLAAPAKRIVTLAPSLAELVYAAGAGEKLVGVSAWSDYPEAARKLPQVGGYGKIDLERLLRLRPDLVIGWRSGNAPGDLERLEKLGIPLYVSEARQLADIPRQIEAIGQLAGTFAHAQQAAAAFRRELDELAGRYAGARPVSVFYQIWHRPLITVNGSHLIDEVIRLCGGVNPYAALPSATPTVSLESLLAADPAAIVVGDAVGYWRRYPQLAAVRNNRLISINPDFLNRATPRLLQGARELCAALEKNRN